MSEYIQVAESEQAATSVELETEVDGMHYFPHIFMVSIEWFQGCKLGVLSF